MATNDAEEDAMSDDNELARLFDKQVVAFQKRSAEYHEGARDMARTIIAMVDTSADVQGLLAEQGGGQVPDPLDAVRSMLASFDALATGPAHPDDCHCDACFKETCDGCGRWGHVTQPEDGGPFTCAECRGETQDYVGYNLPERHRERT
jgi:hypothetical protein